MSGIDDNVAIIGDWMPPSPSPHPFFSAFSGDDINSRTPPEPSRENRGEELFLGSQKEATEGDAEKKDAAQSVGFQFAVLPPFPEQKSSCRAGLVERMAARAGFNAPRLNTESIRSADLSSSPDIRSPYLTIPPGLSPTTLLDSPVFLSNSLVQPSPTTGKFSFMPNSNDRNSALASESADKSKENFFEDTNDSSFAFKPFTGSNSKQEEAGDQRGSGDCNAGGEDGYNWRKYGQKQVKGSEYPRSYYKCTQPNCPVKKKVERSHEGHITEIIYKGVHNHPKPAPSRRSAIDGPDQGRIQSCVDHDPVWAGAHNAEVTSASHEFGNQNDGHFEAGDAVDASSTFSNEEDEDDRATHGSVGYDGEGGELESKRRKIDTYPTDMAGATRAIREPRVVVQTTSEVDILDDGYRWRKYGQKVVKGNPNPRSYYKCTNAGCNVRKHVERASHDLKSVITTYEGKHNHDVPAARNSSHVNSSGANNGNAQARPEPAQLHNGLSRFEKPGAYGSYGRQQLGPSHGFSFGVSQPGLANLAMAGLGPGQPKMPVMGMHPFLAQQRQLNEMGLMLPKGELKMEPLSEPSLNVPNDGSVYQQIMSRLPLGPQM